MSNDERSVPDVSISTEKPGKNPLGYIITYHGNGLTFADGSTENYSSGHIKKYVKETYNKDQGLLYKSEDAARAMVEEWKSTIAQEGDTYNEVINISPQPQASITLMDQYTGQIKAMEIGRASCRERV